MTDGGGHLQVFLAGAVPFLLLLGAYLDVETVGVQTLSHQFVEHYAGIDAAAEQHGYTLVL